MSDGKDVALHTFVPEGEVKAVIQLSHGMAEYAMRYEDVAKFFCDNGFAFYAKAMYVNKKHRNRL